MSDSVQVRKQRDVPVPAGFRIQDHLSMTGARLAGAANFTMQLAWPGVGYGVMNSRVHDGSAMKHPIKRSRTTFTYIAVAMLGTDEERAAYRKAVTGQHAQVYNQPGEPVEYRAMDPRLQTWVAACLYYGTIDVIERMHGPLDDQTADALYAHSARFGTTLQMPAEAWPANRAAFDEYWEASLAEVSIDEPVREYLMKLIRLENFPWWLRGGSRANELLTAGFLPPEFREAMGMTWNDELQGKFDKIIRRWGRIERATPRAARSFPFRVLLWDLRFRRRVGMKLV